MNYLAVDQGNRIKSPYRSSGHVLVGIEAASGSNIFREKKSESNVHRLIRKHKWKGGVPAPVSSLI